MKEYMYIVCQKDTVNHGYGCYELTYSLGTYNKFNSTLFPVFRTEEEAKEFMNKVTKLTYSVVKLPIYRDI